MVTRVEIFQVHFYLLNIFSGEMIGVPLGILPASKLQNYAKEALGRQHLSEPKALEETGGER